MPRIIIDEFEIYLRTECGLSRNTICAYTDDIKEFLDFVGDKEYIIHLIIYKSDLLSLIENFIKHLENKRFKDTSVRRKYMAIRSFCHFLISLGRLDPNILNMLNSVRVERKTHDVLEPSDVDVLISTAKNRAPSSRAINVHRDVAIVLTLYHSGLRVSELCDLNLDDINFTRREIRVKGKGGRDRIVPTTKECIEAILKYSNSYSFHRGNRHCENAVFVDSKGLRITRRAVSDMLILLSRRAGIKHVTAHTLRRTCATFLVNNGVDLELVQVFLGHRDLSTTQSYVVINYDKLAKTHNRCHPFGEKYEIQ
jgi:site-specific recombinase XerD